LFEEMGEDEDLQDGTEEIDHISFASLKVEAARKGVWGLDEKKNPRATDDFT
jgi:hypothetical protein